MKNNVVKRFIIDGMLRSEKVEKRTIYKYKSSGVRYIRTMGRRVPICGDVNGMPMYEWHATSIAGVMFREFAERLAHGSGEVNG